MTLLSYSLLFRVTAFNVTSTHQTRVQNKPVPATPLHIIVLTLYPQMFPGPLGFGLLKKALEKKLWRLSVLNIRDFATDKHASVDAPAVGGGSGMVMRADVVDKALEKAVALAQHQNPRLVYLSPRGTPLTQPIVRTWAHSEHPFKNTEQLATVRPLILLCGRFEGVDQRVLDHWQMEEMSLGDIVLMGGEVAAMAMAESIVRLIPGVLGNPDSLREESFEDHLLEYPQYAKPRLWKGHYVPDVLLSGHHQQVRDWRQKQRAVITKERRPDLWEKYQQAQKK